MQFFKPEANSAQSPRFSNETNMDEASTIQNPVEEERSRVERVVATREYVDDPALLPWYTTNLEEPQPETRDLFEQYSKIPPADVVPHIKQVRDEAFKIVRSFLNLLFHGQHC